MSFAVAEMNPGPRPRHASAIPLSSTHVIFKWNRSHKEKRWKCKQSLASWLFSILFFPSLLIQNKAKSHTQSLICPFLLWLLHLDFEFGAASRCSLWSLLWWLPSSPDSFLILYVQCQEPFYPPVSRKPLPLSLGTVGSVLCIVLSLVLFLVTSTHHLGWDWTQIPSGPSSQVGMMFVETFWPLQ